MRPDFETPDSRPGVRVNDPIESAQFALYTPDPVDFRVTDADEGAFYFPVDRTVAFETRAVEFPRRTPLLVRDDAGDLVTDFGPDEDGETTLPAARYNLEPGSAPMKLYVAVEGDLTLETLDDGIRVEFGEERTVGLGVRSFHQRPAGTVTVGDDVTDVMRAVSLLGSALKTTTPERSFPTLRGHPPLVEHGDGFDAPDGLERPETGIRIEVPPEHRYVYPVAPLAYYLGAEVVPGDTPKLVAAGIERKLPRERFEQAVAETLQTCFLLDCVVRTEGYYEVDLHERGVVLDRVDFDPATVYDLPLDERTAEYLSVPFADVADLVSRWHLTTDVVPTPDNAEMLPFVANDLSVVRCPDRTPSATTSEPEHLTDFYRADGALTRSERSPVDQSDAGTASPDAVGNIVKPDDVDTLEHAWVGEGYPLGANKATPEAYRRRFDRDTPKKSRIEIHVVCNDERMAEEGVVEEFYGLRDMLEFDVNLHFGVETEELRELVAREFDLLHYIGHVDESGFRCPDGYLDARTLDTVNVEAFVLNACRSYEQGEALIDRGSNAGIATLAEVSNDMATRVGRTLARLLNCGFTFRAATAVIKDQNLTGYRYITLGDGGATLVQSDMGVPVVTEVTKGTDGHIETVGQPYPTPQKHIGTLVKVMGRDTARHVNVGTIGPEQFSTDEFEKQLSLRTMPLKIDGEFYWSDEVDVCELFE